jgi:hypothetical protein
LVESLTGFAETLQVSPFGAWAAGSSLAYPVANVVHLLGLVMLVGGIGVVDLRLAGAFPSLSPAALSRALTPIAIAGLLLMLPSGFIMFAADAEALATSDIFLSKLVLIAVALTNAVAFRWLWRKRLIDWRSSPPLAGRLMAAASLLLWLAVGTLGRLIAYY